MYKPLVSIIIPVFNAERYIAETIKSALNQTWPYIEIIVIDDGSTDNSLSIIKSFETSNLSIFTQSNLGASAARNLGLKKSKGEFIQFLDSDDLLSNDKIQYQINLLKDNPNHLAICKTISFTTQIPIVIPENKVWFHRDHNDPLDFLIKLYAQHEVIPDHGGMIQPNAWLTPKSVIERAGLWNETLTVDDDGEFYCRVVLKSEGILYSKEGVNYYRKHKKNTNLSSRASYRDYESMLNATILKFNHLKEVTTKDENIINTIFKNNLQNITVSSYPQFKSISNNAFKMANQIKKEKIKYKFGPVTTKISKLFGWKTIRLINYLRFGR